MTVRNFVGRSDHLSRAVGQAAVAGCVKSVRAVRVHGQARRNRARQRVGQGVAVNVTDPVRHRAAHAQGFADRVGLHRTHHRGVVGTVDGQGDGLLGPVNRFYGSRIGQRVPCPKALDLGQAVVHRVGPVARGVDDQPAVRGVYLCSLEAIFVVNVRGRQLACGMDSVGQEERARRSHTVRISHRKTNNTRSRVQVLGHRPRKVSLNERRVVGARDGDGQG